MSKLADLQKTFEKLFEDQRNDPGITSPFELLIRAMLNAENARFALIVAKLAIARIEKLSEEDKAQ